MDDDDRMLKNSDVGRLGGGTEDAVRVYVRGEDGVWC